MKIQTKRLTVTAMLCAMAYVVMIIGRVPVVLFLKYDPKDVIIVIGGFLFGPLTAFIITAVVSLIEMLTVSDTGLYGLLMNIVQSGAFACTASLIYKKKHDLTGVVIGLAAAWLLTTGVMMLWNYFISPFYMGVERAEVAALLIPAFLPFNLLKGGLNAAITLILYKPLTNALRSFKLMPGTGKGKINTGVILAACFVIFTCVLFILVLQGII